MTDFLEPDLEQIAGQERRLIFQYFDTNIAWTLGCELRTLAESLKVSLVIDIFLHDRQLFYCAMPGRTIDNADWARRQAENDLKLEERT